MKKGFTLIELIAVLIILAVIGLITMPIVNNSIENSREMALEEIISNLENATRLYITENVYGRDSNYKTLSFDELKKKGYIENKDVINPTTNEELTGCIGYKWDTDNNQYKIEYSEECEPKEDEVVTYSAGDYVKVQLNDNDTANFYVLEDNGNKVTAILDRNYAESKWGNAGDTIPTIANAALPKNWINASEVRLPSVEDLIVHTDWYKELSDKDNWKSQSYEYSMLPGWLGYDSNNSLEYWTTDPFDSNSINVATNSCEKAFSLVSFTGRLGVRPIIVIDKSYIISTLEKSTSEYSCVSSPT